MPTDGYRNLFSQVHMVRDLCRAFLCEEWVQWLDLDTLEPAAVPSPPLAPPHDLLVWRVRWQGGSAWTFLLLKLQGEEDPAMALRMGFYRELLYQDLLACQPSARLPIVLPVVVYNGERPWQAARDALELFFPLPASLQRHAPRTRYLLLDAVRDPIPKTAGADNFVSLLWRLERSRTPAAVDALMEGLIASISGLKDDALRQAWSAFLGRFLPRRFPDLFTPEVMESWGAGGVLA